MNETAVSDAAKGRRGRKPASESRSAEIKQRIAEWKLTPKRKRQPPTLGELAGELGIRPSLASYYARQIPDSVDDLLDRIPAIALVRLCPGIFDMVRKSLEKQFKRRNGGWLALRFLEKMGVLVVSQFARDTISSKPQT